MNQHGAWILSGGLILLFLGGCGLKTDPVPPGAVIPMAIDDLGYRLDEKGVNLSWTYPPLSVQGASIDNIREFKIFKAARNEADYCAECPLKYDVFYTVDAARLKPGRHVKFKDIDLKSGYHYFYVVQSHSGWNIHSHDSNRVDFVWLSPLSPPENIRAEAGDRLVTLSWEAPQTLEDGSPAPASFGYRLSRSTDNKKFKIITPIIKETSFVDGSVKNAVDYFYKVTAVFQDGETIYPGLTSEAVKVRPLDTTPPAPPVQVKCVRTASEVKIFWENSTETDISRYRIYRRPADQSRAELIGETGGAAQIFIDKNPPTDAEVWYYSVTALDNAETPNESVSSVEAEMRWKRAK